MARKHKSPAIHIILQKRRGIDCVGKQSWEVDKIQGSFSCCACGLRGYRKRLESNQFPRNNYKGAEGEKGPLTLCGVIFAWWFELLSDVAWQGEKGVREGGMAE